jgi:pimeloyl-ACP methyl ester carboxylesterase
MRRSFPAGVHRAGASRTCHPGRYAALPSPDPIHNFNSYLLPDPIVRETAERIPQATLRLYDGVGHAVSKTHKRRFEDDVLSFLRR